MINKIESNIGEGKIIIFSDLENIYPIFYELFNKNYIIKDNKKYYRISYPNNIQKLIFVNEKTKFIILIDKKDLRKQNLGFLSLFEKYIINFKNFLDEKDKEKSEIICNILKDMVTIKDINYNMNNLLININEDIINGYVYLYKNKENNSYKNIIKENIIQILPQDIIYTLSNSALIKEKYILDLKNDIFANNQYYCNNLEEYLKNNKERKENILIVYTFSEVGEFINLTDKENYMEKIIEEINNIYEFKQLLNNFNESRKFKSLILKFDKNNTEYINFIISEINNYKTTNKNLDKNKNYIFTINVQREFNLENNNNKITTILNTDDNINQLFIDNLNGIKLPMKDLYGKNIEYFMSKEYLDINKIIIESMVEFYRENIFDQEIGKYKGIDINNFIKEFKYFIENSDESILINDIKRIILNICNDKENIIDLIIKNKIINKDTISIKTLLILYQLLYYI